MAPKLSKDSLQAALARRRAQAIQGGPSMAIPKPSQDSSKTTSGCTPLIIK